MLQSIGVSCPNVHKYAEKEDTARIKISDRRVQENTLEGRMRRRQEQIDVLEAATAAAKGLLYGPGIDDYVYAPGLGQSSIGQPSSDLDMELMQPIDENLNLDQLQNFNFNLQDFTDVSTYNAIKPQ